MTFTEQVNNDFLYSSPDGREAYIAFDPTKGLAYVVTDIRKQGPPNNAVGFTAKTLRQIAAHLDHLDERTTGEAG
jgi:hypothetical protein